VERIWSIKCRTTAHDAKTRYYYKLTKCPIDPLWLIRGWIASWRDKNNVGYGQNREKTS